MERDYVVPTDFVKYNYVSQLLQARGMKIAIEAHRREKPDNMGTLYWQLNDCWPVISWSSIDYLGNWKALHYQVKRSFENKVILAEEKSETLNFYAVNDALEKFQNISLEFQTMDFSGKILIKKELQPAGKDLKDILKFESLKTSELFANYDKNKIFLKLSLKDVNSKIIAENIYFFSKPKDLKLTKPRISIKKISPNEIEISTDVLAKDVYLMGQTHFSDNFYDLLPNTKRIIRLSAPVSDIKILSLWDTLNN
jgi:beta-mannosidase